MWTKYATAITFDFYMGQPHIVASKCCIYGWRGFYVWGWGGGAYLWDTIVLRRRVLGRRRPGYKAVKKIVLRKLDAKSSPYHVKIHLDQSGSGTIRQCLGLWLGPQTDTFTILYFMWIVVVQDLQKSTTLFSTIIYIELLSISNTHVVQCVLPIAHHQYCPTRARMNKRLE